MQAHFAPDSKFDFQKYIKRSMKDDFKVVVGIRYLSSDLKVTNALILQDFLMPSVFFFTILVFVLQHSVMGFCNRLYACERLQ